MALKSSVTALGTTVMGKTSRCRSGNVRGLYEGAARIGSAEYRLTPKYDQPKPAECQLVTNCILPGSANGAQSFR
jgi:hypothetical protein